jgi:hypothetical protein
VQTHHSAVLVNQLKGHTNPYHDHTVTEYAHREYK